MGNDAGFENTSGGRNVFMGNLAGQKNKSGFGNVFTGYQAGNLNTSGIYNVFMGGYAGNSNTAGNFNTFLGYESGAFSTTASSNTFLGYQAGYLNTTGNLNVFVGNQTGYRNTTGVANVFIGSQAGVNNTTGTGNMFLGQLAGLSNTNANYNLFMGNSAGQATTTGSGNTAIGDGSGLRNTTGQQNTNIGQYAGVYNETGSNNVFIGFAAGPTQQTTNITNAIAIGANAVVSQNNSLVLGNNVNVGIGTSTPSHKLHVAAGTADQSGLRLENLTSSSPASMTNQTKFLTVDGLGNVILGSTSSNARQVAVDGLWQRNGSYLQSVDDNAVVIGQGISKTPSGYRLFVEEGILTEKIKVAVKNKDAWSDYVFEKGYKLMPLAEIEQHIKQKGHLPGIPSAAEVVEQGVDMVQMDAKLLEKIEELTLHSIQLEKKLQEGEKKHQAEIDELRQLVKQLLNR